MNKNFISALIVTLSIVSSSAFSTVLIQPTPKPSTGSGSGTGTGTGTTKIVLSAVDDAETILAGQSPSSSVIGNVTSNDPNVTTFATNIKIALQSSLIGKYGYIQFNSTGAYTYKLYERLPVLLALKGGQFLTDKFTYSLQSGIQQSTATLTITILGNPDNISNGSDVENVEIEYNNSFDKANALNPGQMIKGHLMASNDRDWYSIGSPGDEIIHIEVCASGSVCYGKKSWVMYVFDSTKLTPEIANAAVPLTITRNDTGEVIDAYYSDSMYLAYNYGAYEGALVGVVDPCYDTTNSVDIGAPKGARTYFVAISVPLERDGTPKGCSNGSVLLKKAGEPIFDAGKKVETTRQYISAFPNSDDEYALTVSNTGKKPLAVNNVSGSPASAAAAPYAPSQALPTLNESKHQLVVPKVRIFNDLYSATLSYQGSIVKKSFNPSEEVRLSLKKISGLSEALSGDPYQATYNPENNQVVLSRILDTKSGEFYSAVFKYHPPEGKKPLWLEAVSVTLVQ
ncbi:MAG: VCBS domain-containing protein [Methylococcales bacterium]|nr:hypothetical protein [Methylococcaceae bacterium]